MFLDELEKEASNQLNFYNSCLSDGWELAEDPAGLGPNIGEIVRLEVLCQHFTPNLLAKLFVKGTEELERSFMLVPVWQIVKYGKLIPKPGTYFTCPFVIGVRRITKERKFLYTLRLPRE